MKWFTAILFIGLCVAAFLVRTIAVEFNRLNTVAPPHPGNIAFPLVLVVVVFIIAVGIWMLVARK